MTWVEKWTSYLVISLDSYYTYLRQYLLTSGKIRLQNSSQRYHQQAWCGGHVTIVKFKGNTAFMAIAFMFEKKKWHQFMKIILLNKTQVSQTFSCPMGIILLTFYQSKLSSDNLQVGLKMKSSPCLRLLVLVLVMQFATTAYTVTVIKAWRRWPVSCSLHKTHKWGHTIWTSLSATICLQSVFSLYLWLITLVFMPVSNTGTTFIFMGCVCP